MADFLNHPSKPKEDDHQEDGKEMTLCWLLGHKKKSPDDPKWRDCVILGADLIRDVPA